MKAPSLKRRQTRFQQLRGFCYAAAAGSFSRAASQLSLTQPAVSQQIKSLESELQLLLFNRSAGHLELTHDGVLLFQMARPLVEEVERLESRFLRQRLEIEEGQVHVAAGLSTILYLLPRHVETFRRAYPKIELYLQQVSGPEGLARVREDKADFAVGSLPQVPGDIDFHPIASYDAVLITPRSHPLAREKEITLEKIGRYPLILPPRTLSTAIMVDTAFKERGLAYQVAMEVGGWEAIKTYVEMGMGISVILRIGLRGSENLEVLPAAGLFPGRTYGVILLKRRLLSPQARRFANLLISSSTLSPPIPVPAKEPNPAGSQSQPAQPSQP